MDEIGPLLEQCLLHAGHVRNLSRAYIASVRGSCRLFLRHSRATRLRECTREAVEAWLLDGRVNGKWGPATFRARHRDLGFLFRYLAKRGRVTEDPTKGVELPKIGNPLPKGLTAEQAELVLAASRRLRYSYRFEAKRNAALVALLLFTGLRKAEALSLRTGDVDLSSMSLRVIRGKGGKDRIVPVSTRLGAILKEYLADRERLGKACENLFTSAQHDSPMPAKAVNELMGRLRDRTGVGFTAHGLRHTFATLMLEGGCDLFTLSKMMGHSRVTTTTIYLSCTAKMMTSSIEKHPLN